MGGEKWVSGDVGGEEMFLPIEEMVPKGKGDKPFWSRGVDLMGYSLNSMRISNLGFGDVGVERASEVVRMQMSREETDRILAVSDLWVSWFFPSAIAFLLFLVSFCFCFLDYWFVLLRLVWEFVAGYGWIF